MVLVLEEIVAALTTEEVSAGEYPYALANFVLSEVLSRDVIAIVHESAKAEAATELEVAKCLNALGFWLG